MAGSPDHVGCRWFDELRVHGPGSIGFCVVFAGWRTKYASDKVEPGEFRGAGGKRIGEADVDPEPGVGE